MADLGAIVAQLKQERAKLDKAIAALSGLAGNSVGGWTWDSQTLSSSSCQDRSGAASEMGEVQGEEGEIAMIK